MTILLRSLVLFLMFGTAFSSAQNLGQRLDSYLSQFNNTQLMGAVVISENGTPVYENYLGDADVENDIANDSLKRFAIGDLKTLMTSAMLYQLIEEKKLKLETPLSKYYPTFPNADSISVERLLAQRSGLSDLDTSIEITEDAEHPKLIDSILTTKRNAEPGKRKRFSETNTIVMALLLEELTKTSFKDNFKLRILDKADLSYTEYITENSQATRLAKPYEVNDGSREVVALEELSAFIGGGQIVSSPREMNWFLYNLFNDEVLKRTSLETMVGDKGIQSINVKGRIFHGYVSETNGYNVASFYHPEKDVAVSYAFNLINTPDFDLKELLTIVLDIPIRKEIALEDGALDKYKGNYAMNLGFNVAVTVEDNKLMVTPDNGMPVLPMLPMGEDKFFNKSFNIELEFEELSPNSYDLVVRPLGGSPIRGSKTN